MDCPFCNLNLERTRILHEGSHTKVILSNPRLMPGHLLVVPHRHAEKLSDLSEAERKELLETVILFQDKILTRFAGGCDVRHNYRPFQKQTNLKVHHLHVHLQPRELEDELYRECQIHETKVFTPLLEEEKEKFSRLFN